MARYCLFEPGLPGASYSGGWDDYTSTNDVLATLKAVYAPVITEEAPLVGCNSSFSTTHIAHIIDTNLDPPEVVSRSCITDQGVAGWVDT